MFSWSSRYFRVIWKPSADPQTSFASCGYVEGFFRHENRFLMHFEEGEEQKTKWCIQGHLVTSLWIAVELFNNLSM